MISMKLCGVVVLFHPEEDVIENIKTYIGELDRLYIIDNSEESHRDLFTMKKAKYIKNDENKGIGFALNQAAQFANEEGYRYLLTMDQDSRFEAEGLKKMKEEITTGDYENDAIFTPLHVTNSQSINHTIETDQLVVMTSGNILDLNIFREVGGMKDWFFIDGIDQEYCLNIRKHGYQIKVFDEIHLKHSLGNIGTKRLFGKTISFTNHSAMRRYFIVRNRLYINEMYQHDFPTFCKQELSNSRKEAIKIILFEKDKWKKIKAIRRAQRDFKHKITGIPSWLKEVLK